MHGRGFGNEGSMGTGGGQCPKSRPPSVPRSTTSRAPSPIPAASSSYDHYHHPGSNVVHQPSSNVSTFDDQNIAQSYYASAQYIRRITELQRDLDEKKKGMESTRFHNISRVGNQFAGFGQTSSISPWMGGNREGVLSTRLRTVEDRNKQLSEEREQLQLVDAALERELNGVRKDLDEAHALRQKEQMQHSIALRQKEADIAILNDRIQLLYLDLEKAASGPSEVEATSRAFIEDERREIQQTRQNQEVAKYSLEQRENKVVADCNRLKREKEELTRRKSELDANVRIYKENKEMLENVKSEYEANLRIYKENKENLEKQERKLELRERRIEEDEKRLDNQYAEMEEEAAAKSMKLMKQETDLGRQEAELNRRLLEVEGLKKELAKKLETTARQSDVVSPTMNISGKLEEEVEHWKEKYENLLKVQRTLEQQSKMREMMSAQPSAPSLLKRKPSPKPSLSQQPKSDVDTLATLMKAQGEGQKTDKRRKARSPSHDSVAPSVGGSKRGRKAQATPDVSAASASPPVASQDIGDGPTAAVLSPGKRRKQEQSSSSKKATDKSQIPPAAKKPPRPRTRAANSDAEPGS